MHVAGKLVFVALGAVVVTAATRATAQRAPWAVGDAPAPGAFVIPIARAYDEGSAPVPLPTGPLLGLITRYDDHAPSGDGVVVLPTLFIAADARGDRGLGPGGLLALYREYDASAPEARGDRLASGLPLARDYDDGAPRAVLELPEVAIDATDREAGPHVLLPAVRVTP